MVDCKNCKFALDCSGEEMLTCKSFSPRVQDNKLFWIYALVAMTFFSQGMEDLPGQSLFFFFKNTLHLTPSTMMYLGSIISIPWIIKPILGWFSDSYLTKRLIVQITLIGSIVFSFMFWGAKGLPLWWIVSALTALAFFAAMRSTAVGGVSCIEGKNYNTIEKLQSIRWVFITLAGVITGLVGGFLAEHYSYQIAFLAVIPFYVILGLTVNRFIESEVSKEKISFIANLKSYKSVFTDKRFLLLCVFLFLYNYSPSFGTPLSFIQYDKFHWSKQFMGVLAAISAGMSIVGAFLYYKFANKVNIKTLLYVSVWVGALISLCYLYYTPVSAIIYDVVFSVVGMFVELVIMTWMTQCSLSGKEATSFAVMCSINNLAGTCSTLSGAYLLPKIGLTWLIILSAATSFICLPLISKLEMKK